MAARRFRRPATGRLVIAIPSSVRRALGATVVTGALLWGVVGASAAPVGGSGGVPAGGGIAAVSACQSGNVTFAYVNTWSASLSRFQTTGVRVHGVSSPACNGKSIYVNLRDGSNTLLAYGQAVVAGSTVDVPINNPADGGQATLVAGVAAIILG